MDKAQFDAAVLTNREVFATVLQKHRGHIDTNGRTGEDFARVIRSVLNGDLTYDRKTFLEVAAFASLAAEQLRGASPEEST